MKYLLEAIVRSAGRSMVPGSLRRTISRAAIAVSTALLLAAGAALLPRGAASEPSVPARDSMAAAAIAERLQDEADMTFTPEEAAQLRTPVPAEWLPSRGRECIRKGPYKGHCQGPRRVPRPHGPAARLAEELGLGSTRVAGYLLRRPPKEKWLAHAGEPTDEHDLLWPVEDGKLWRGFGRVRRNSRKLHKGVDIGSPEGTRMRAVADGLVAYSDNGVRGYGNMILIIHPNATVSLHAHCRAAYVFPGQKVTRGQIIGEVGHTGIARGPHLHYEWRVRGRPRDPLPHFVRGSS